MALLKPFICLWISFFTTTGGIPFRMGKAMVTSPPLIWSEGASALHLARPTLGSDGKNDGVHLSTVIYFDQFHLMGIENPREKQPVLADAPKQG